MTLEEKMDSITTAISEAVLACNVMGLEKQVAEAIFEGIRYHHRTLQANFWRNIRAAAKIYAEQAESDMRNAAAVDLCREIGKIETYVPCI